MHHQTPEVNETKTSTICSSCKAISDAEMYLMWVKFHIVGPTKWRMSDVMERMENEGLSLEQAIDAHIKEVD